MSSHHVKFEGGFNTSPASSIADSFASTPGTSYPPIFDDSPMIHPLDQFTPRSFDDEYDESVESTPAPEPAQKPPVKKRKSWGQQLPEPKTNLPPRKRAKTEDEKEQRRVERVLRNRRAAQSSRERKRVEVENLEKQKEMVEQQSREYKRAWEESQAREIQKEQRIRQLEQQLAAISGGDISAFRQPSITSNYAPTSEPLLRCTTPLSLTHELFSSHDAHRNTSNTSSSSSSYSSVQASPQTVRTVNPASLSPEMQPVEQSNASSSDLTQHPAAVLCDLQCQSEERTWPSSGNRNSSAAVCLQQMVLAVFLTLTSTISLLTTPMSMVCHSLKTGSPLPPTTSILSTIMWLATATKTSTSAITSTTITRGQCPQFGLRMRLLRRLLACNPQLARPLLDATLGKMRLVSEQQIVYKSSSSGLAKSESRGAGNPVNLFKLMTMAHSIKVIMKQQRHLKLAQTRPLGQGNEDLMEILGRYHISFASGIGDFGSRTAEKSLANGKGAL